MRIENKQAKKNILVVRNDRFGEFLLNIPAFRAVKDTFSDCCLIALVDPAVSGLALATGYFDEVIPWKQERHSLKEKVGLIRLLRQKNIDTAIILNPAKEMNIISFLSGIPLRIGYDRKFGFLLNRKLKDTKHLGQKHEVEYNLDLVSLLPARTGDRRLSLKIREKPPIAERDFVMIHPWTSDPIKQWPLQRFVELAGRVISELGFKVAIVGGKENAEESKRRFSSLGEGLIDLTGKTTLEELAALLGVCRILVTADSGPMHLAACMNTPVIALFSNAIAGKSSRRWGPWGDGHTVIEKRTLKEITTEEVLFKLKERLSR